MVERALAEPVAVEQLALARASCAELQARRAAVYVDPAVVALRARDRASRRASSPTHGLEELAPLRRLRRQPARPDQPRRSAPRALALLRGRRYVLPQDVRELAKDVLRHRIVLSYQALAEGVDADTILDRVLEADRRCRSSTSPAGASRDAALASPRPHDPAAPAPARCPARAAAPARTSPSAGASTACSPATTARAALGDGTELAQIRPYEPRRRRPPHRLERDRAHRRAARPRRTSPSARSRPGCVLDTSASMTFGTADRRKWDVAEGVALALGHFAARRGNRLARRRPSATATPTHARRRGRAARGLLGAPARRLRREPELEPRRADVARRGARRGSARLARAPVARSSSSPTSAARATGGRAAAARRPPRRHRGRDPRPARAGAAGRRRPLARRPRDRAVSCASTRAAASCGERFGERAAAERDEVARELPLARRRARRALDLRATGCGRSSASCRPKGGGDELRLADRPLRPRCSSPLALLAYLRRRSGGARSTPCASRTSTLLENVVDRLARAGAGTSRRRSTLLALTRARRRRRPAAMAVEAVPREEATVDPRHGPLRLDDRDRRRARPA